MVASQQYLVNAVKIVDLTSGNKAYMVYKMEGNELCSLCGLQQGKRLCVCSNLPLVCTQCLAKHETQPGFHFLLPVEAHRYVNRSNQVQYQIWLVALKNSQEKLRENMSFFEQCKADIEAQSVNVQRELNEMTTNLLWKLEELSRALGAEIEQAIQETSANGYRADYEPQTYLATQIWLHSRSQSSDPITLFACQIKPDEAVKDCLGVSFQTYVPDLQHLNHVPDSQQLLKTVRAQRLIASLGRVSTKTLRDAFERVLADHWQVKGSLRCIMLQLRGRNKSAFSRWQHFVRNEKAGLLCETMKALRLASLLFKVPARRLRNAGDRIFGGNCRIKSSVHSLRQVLAVRLKDVFLNWKDCVHVLKTQSVLDCLRAHKLRISFSTVPVGKIRDAFDRMRGKDSHMKGVLRGLARQLVKLPKQSLRAWGQYITETTKLAHLLRASLSHLPRRNLRDAIGRVLADKAKVNSKLRSFIYIRTQKQKEIRDTWKLYVVTARMLSAFDALRAQKLTTFLSRVSLRTVRNSYSRLTEDELKVKGAIRSLLHKLTQQPKTAMIVWRLYVEDLKKETLIAAIKTQKFASAMTKLMRPTMRNIYGKILANPFGEIKANPLLNVEMVLGLIDPVVCMCRGRKVTEISRCLKELLGRTDLGQILADLTGITKLEERASWLLIYTNLKSLRAKKFPLGL